jgi:NAD(P)-dependent dehydrogenase (short-subunit alcohol dehydrogenase family)
MTSAALKDRVAIVFGSATGIGAACARTLAARGAIVILADIAMVGQAETEFGRLNIVPNNAAAMHSAAALAGELTQTAYRVSKAAVVQRASGDVCRPSW